MEEVRILRECDGSGELKASVSYMLEWEMWMKG